MRLIEADGKMLLRRRGLPVPRGRLYADDAPIEAPAGGAVVKAQVLAGARGKQGLVRVTEAAEVAGVAATMRERMRQMGAPPSFLVEERVAIEAEYYLAWRIDDVRQAPVLLFSPRGGIDIEAHGEVRQLVWSPLQPLFPHHLVHFLTESGAAPRPLGALARFAADLY